MKIIVGRKSKFLFSLLNAPTISSVNEILNNSKENPQ